MDLGGKESLTLDEIILQRNIQAPPSATSRHRGVGFGRPVLPRPSGAPSVAMSVASSINSSSGVMATLYQAAYHAGVQAGLTLRAPPTQTSFVHRRTIPQLVPQQRVTLYRGRGYHHRGSFQRGGISRGGSDRAGSGRGGISREGSSRGGSSRGRSSRGGFGRGDFGRGGLARDWTYTLGDDRDSSKPPLADRLGWFAGQRLTHAQQTARNKLSLAKQRLNGYSGFGNQNFGPKSFAAAVVKDKMKRASHWRSQNQQHRAPAMPPPAWMPGVSPLIRQNVAQLPGGGASTGGQSVKSFSAYSRTSRATSRSRSRSQNRQRYTFNNQQYPPATPSIASLQANVRQGPWQYTLKRHEPVLDTQLQSAIASLQAFGEPNHANHESALQYRTFVRPTDTSTSDRFSLLMSL